MIIVVSESQESRSAAGARLMRPPPWHPGLGGATVAQAATTEKAAPAAAGGCHVGAVERVMKKKANALGRPGDRAGACRGGRGGRGGPGRMGRHGRACTVTL